MMQDRYTGPTRRTLLLTGAAASLLGTTMSAAAATPPTLRLRPDLTSTAGQKMAKLYAAAVQAMQNPALNYPPQPQSWIFQSFIHGVPANPFDPANSAGLRHGTPELKTRIDQMYGMPAAGTPQAHWKQAALDCWATCTHSSPYFTVWHRWYMYYFERVCRTMCKDPSFMLPYWNYASDIGPSLQLPTAFTGPNPSLLFDDRGLGFANPQGTGPQNVAMNNNGYMPYPQIDYGPALAAKVMFPSDTDFFAPPSPGYTALGFSGRLECVPHDMVHDNVGGWMGNVPSAAGDPIFFVHHCQVDRLYASWEAESGVSYNFGTSPTQPPESTWKIHKASFVDETGAIVTKEMGGAIDTSVLGYTYDNLAKPQPKPIVVSESLRPESAAPTFVLAAMKGGQVRVGGTGGSVTLSQDAQPHLAEAAPGGGPKATTLVLQGLKLLRRPPAPLSVFLNLPKGTAPALDSPYYVGTLNLFKVEVGTGEAMHHDDGVPMEGAGKHDASPRFDVGRVLQTQKDRGLWNGGPVTVTITTIGVDSPTDITYVTFAGVSLLP